VSDTDESLSRVLRSFRPLGESQAIDQALRMLAVRANTDEELRKQLLQDPLDVLRSLNVPVNPDLCIEVHEEQSDELQLVLPMNDEAAADLAPPLAGLLRRAQDDADLRQALLEEPEQVVVRELGQRVPRGFRFVVHENSMLKKHVVLPLTRVGGELSERELDQVAAAGLTVSPLFRRQPKKSR
jgi:hypothetical protein